MAFGWPWKRRREAELDEEIQSHLEMAARDRIGRGETLVIRTAGEPAVVAATARAAIWSIDKDQPIARVRTMDDVIASELALPSKSSALLSAFSILALLLSRLGIYGVLSHAVARRRAEIGVRMALGATPVSIVRLVASRGFALAGAGLVIGMAASIPVSRLMSTLLYEVPPVDWLTIGASGLTLLAVAALASAFPAGGRQTWIRLWPCARNKVSEPET